jgi:hypothetical protein
VSAYREPVRHISHIHSKIRSRGSSVSTVSDYGLEDRAIGFRSPAGPKDFSLASVSRPALGPTRPLYNGYWGSFPGAKRGRGVTLTTYTHLLPKSRMSRSYTSSPPPRLCFLLENYPLFLGVQVASSSQSSTKKFPIHTTRTTSSHPDNMRCIVTSSL